MSSSSMYDVEVRVKSFTVTRCYPTSFNTPDDNDMDDENDGIIRSGDDEDDENHHTLDLRGDATNVDDADNEDCDEV